jgi:hypothetical protein
MITLRKESRLNDYRAINLPYSNMQLVKKNQHVSIARDLLATNHTQKGAQ